MQTMMPVVQNHPVNVTARHMIFVLAVLYCCLLCPADAVRLSSSSHDETAAESCCDGLSPGVFPSAIDESRPTRGRLPVMVIRATETIVDEPKVVALACVCLPAARPLQNNSEDKYSPSANIWHLHYEGPITIEVRRKAKCTPVKCTWLSDFKARATQVVDVSITNTAASNLPPKLVSL